jgi:hypothetical protein
MSFAECGTDRRQHRTQTHLHLKVIQQTALHVKIHAAMIAVHHRLRDKINTMKIFDQKQYLKNSVIKTQRKKETRYQTEEEGTK